MPRATAISLDSDMLVVAALDRSIHVFRLNDGELLWSVAYQQFGPPFVSGRVMIAHNDGATGYVFFTTERVIVRDGIGSRTS